MESTYLHGTTPAEQDRLSQLNRLLNDAALQKLSLRGGERIVDFGCGLAQLTRGMARAAGTRVVGIERSAEQLAEGARQAAAAGETALLELRQGDVLSPPIEGPEWGTFDVAHARFVLEHVRDPAAVVRRMVAAVRPGGRVVLQDDDHDVLRLQPEPPGFWPLWSAYMRTYDRLGCDPYIGRRMPSLLEQAGAAPVRADFIFFGACKGEPRFAAFAENLIGILAGAREPIIAGDLLEARAVDGTLEAIRTWALRPDATLWYALFWAEGVRR